MLRILHIIDNADDEEVRLALEPLLTSNHAAKHWHAELIVIGRTAAWMNDGVPIRARPGRSGGMPLLVAPVLRRHIDEGRFDIVHCWSLSTAESAILSAAGRLPVVMTAWDPHLGRGASRSIRVLRHADTPAALCHTERVRRCWSARGWPVERSVVVRPGVDFGRLNRLRREPIPRAWRSGDHERLVLVAGTPSPRGGHRLALWAAIAAHYLQPDLRLLMAGCSEESRRLGRFAARQPNGNLLRQVNGEPLERLMVAADLLLVPASDDISATQLAWAMAAGLPILGFATYSIAELIASGLNGELVKPRDMRALISKMLDMLARPDEYRRLRDTASGHAFDAFGMTRYVEQVQHAYENVLAGHDVGEGMVDSAADV